MIDPPVTASERLTDALFQLANSMSRLCESFEILLCTLIVAVPTPNTPLDAGPETL